MADTGDRAPVARRVWRTKSALRLLAPVEEAKDDPEAESSSSKSSSLSKFSSSSSLFVTLICAVGAVVVVLLLAVVVAASSLDLGRIYRRTLRYVFLVVALLAFRILAPELLGYVLSFCVTKFALGDEFALEFRGVRLAPWLEFAAAEETMAEPELGRPRAQFVAENESGDFALADNRTTAESTVSAAEPVPSSRHQRQRRPSHHHQGGGDPPAAAAAGASSSSSSSSSTVFGRFVRFLARSRVCVEIRVKRFAMTNPKRSRSSNWCRDRFVSATEIELVASATVADLARLVHLTKVWSWRPRDQPIRPRADGGKLPFGAVRDPKTKTIRNRTMLGVIDVERFDLCDAEVAFEQCDGRFNASAVGTAIAHAELGQQASRAKTAPSSSSALNKASEASRFVVERKPNRLAVSVVAARHLDVAKREQHSLETTKHLSLAGAAAATAGVATAAASHLASAVTFGAMAANTAGDLVPSTFAYVRVRQANRRSRTIMKSSNPSFAYEPEPIAVTDPSAVVHVVVYDEGRFGNAILGQWAGTLKQLCLDPTLCDGGNGVEVTVADDFVEFTGWLPLRDAKWRPFHVPAFLQPNRELPVLVVKGGGGGKDKGSSGGGKKGDHDEQQQQQQQQQQHHHHTTGDAFGFSAFSRSFLDEAEEESESSEAPLPSSRLHDEPGIGYPAVRVRLRWDRLATLGDDFDEGRALKAMESMKINSAETAARCGNVENVRAMLASFPYWLDCRGGFKIRGKATAHVRDLFLGQEGELEKKRKKHGHLTKRDWADARSKAIHLSKIEVSFPIADETKRTFEEEGDGKFFHVFSPPAVGVEEIHGYLTLDGALVELVKGLFTRILASGKVGASILHVLSAVGAGAIAAPPAPRRRRPSSSEQPSEEEAEEETDQRARHDKEAQKLLKKHGYADRQALGYGLRGTRSDRQFALMLGLVQKAPHKIFDARAVDDLTAPVVACGVLLKASAYTSSRGDVSLSKSLGLPGPGGERTRKWHPCWCVLRGSTIFYFRVTSGDASQARRAGEDHVVDLRRVVGDDYDSTYSLTGGAPAASVEGEGDQQMAYVEAAESFTELPRMILTKDGDDDDLLELRVRRDNGGVYTVYLKATQKKKEVSVSSPARISATAWDDEAVAALEESASTTLLDWRDAIVHAVARERARARDEIRHMLGEYRRSQKEETRGGGGVTQGADGAVLREALRRLRDKEDTFALSSGSSSQTPTLSSSCIPAVVVPSSRPLSRVKDSPLNGAWEMTRRGSQLDRLMASEGITFGARIIASAAPASLYVNISDSNHCVVYNRDGFLPQRFVGPLDSAFQMLVVADDPASPVCSALTTLSPDGRTLLMAQCSPATAHVFFKCELRLRDQNTVEQRFKYAHALGDPDVTNHGLLFNEGGDFDVFKRMPPDRAEKLELNAM